MEAIRATRSRGTSIVEEMNLWRNQLAKLVVWLLVGIVPAQPVVALDCACSCHESQEEACCTEETNDTCHAHDDDSHDGHQHHHSDDGAEVERIASSGHDVVANSCLFEVGLRPCNCPSDCDCQWQHEANAAVEVTSKVKIDRVMTAYFLAPMLGVMRDAVFCPACGVRPHPSDKLTALEFCALLCRFTS
jgi:hypothetical protein